MKKLRFFLPLAALGLLASCANEEVNMPNEPQGEPGGVYLTFNLDMPGTRAAGDYLSGTANEEAIDDLTLLFVDSEGTDKDKVRAKIELTELTVSANSTANDRIDATVTVKQKADDYLGELYNCVGHKVKVLAYANKAQFGTPDITSSATAPGAIVGTEFNISTSTNIGSFLGSGAKTENQGKTMPMASINYAQSGSSDLVVNAFENLTGNLSGTLAQTEAKKAFTGEGEELTLNLGTIDLERAVARLDIKDVNNGTAWTYNLMDGKNGPDSGIDLQLYSILPVNINPSSYIFHQTASPSAETVSFLGAESNTNYYVDPTWNYSSGWTKTLTGVTGITATQVSSLTTASYDLVDGYFPWYYVSENTLPANNLTLSEVATGVKFRFQVLDKNKTVITPSSSKGNLPTGVTIGEGTNNKSTLTIVLPNSNMQQTFEEEDGAFYVDYYGYVEHDTNGMKNGVVRNNVYQLSITSISSLPNGNGVKYFLTMNVNVLSWTKRTNGFAW